MLADWINKNDEEFQDRLGTFLADVAAFGDRLGLGPHDLMQLMTARRELGRCVEEQAARQTAFRHAVAAKKAQRLMLDRELRRLVRRINHDPGMTDNLRTFLGLMVPDPEHFDIRADEDRLRSEWPVASATGSLTK